MPDYTHNKKLYKPNRKDEIEVDTSLAQNFEIIDNEFQNVEDEIKNTNDTIDQLVIEGDSSVEAALARKSITGVTYTTLKQRLDAEHQEVTQGLVAAEEGLNGRIDNIVANEGDGTKDIELVDLRYSPTHDRTYGSAQARIVALENELKVTVKNTAKIYGVQWDRSANPSMTRIGDSIGMIASVGVDAQVVRNDFDYAQIYRDIQTVVDGYGNYFRRIPKFYIRKKNSPLYYSEEISYAQLEGFYRPAEFWDFENNVELPYYDHAIHLASESADGKLESKPDKHPLVDRNIVQFRTLAQANNVNGQSGYQQLDIHAHDILSVLFRIEFATSHSQSVMAGWSTGRYTASDLAAVTETATNRFILPKANAAYYAIGQPISVGTSQGGNQIFYGRDIVAIEEYDAGNSAIVFDGAPVNIAVGNVLYNTGWRTGFSSQIAASSGSIGDNTSGKFPCMYRGIESPWGDVYQFVDGINITDHQTWIAQDARDYASNLFMDPYEPLSYVNHDANGYVSEMGFDENHPYAQFPVAVGAGSTTYYGDYYYQTTGARIARVGGFWTYGSVAGLSSWYLSNSSGTAYVSVGGRLLKKAS